MLEGGIGRRERLIQRMRKGEGRQMSKKDGEPQRKGEDMREEFKGKSSNYWEWDLGKGIYKKSFGSLAV